uniref:Inorganic triphosphatase YgiF, contains CYTH and CHAD domains n=1 Tax=Candidatus Kentrum eta TaxID=2126337 RepID=A0A450V4W9_9GAMM|nr:MAG: Inorganic triphosphatase YgiF, contains CYTH and CHAD domains [Candidatus Kentron sp. H]VFJ99861.1 MAG: Inorganic triphosphatase YgiF, contains CYTH and CHAD domains [Candidatus Kentron sp. H]VFK04236.1 MAG: Inorganic triphosphatase YgiF, contains CYTH and CHAD domains [Candidatus Kentron sp. H]
MTIETELKLRFLVPEDTAKLSTHPLLANAGVGAVEQLIATYYDTPARELLELGFALRVRREGGRLLQTIKTAKAGFGGLHQRYEWEREVREDAMLKDGPDLSQLPEILREETFNADLLKRLAPCFTTDFKRTQWILPLVDEGSADGRDAKGGYVEVCLDQGEVRNGEHTAPLHEVELELKGNDDDPTRLYEIALQLQQTLPLVIENTSKAQRGYQLGACEPSASFAPVPQKAQPVALNPEISVQEAFISIMNNGYAQLGTDPEGVHRMQGGLRRMRTCLSLFEPLIPPDSSRALRAELSWIAHILGHARDWDVFTETLDGTDERLQSLQREAHEKRQSCYRDLREALGSVRYSRLLLNLGAWLSGRYWLSNPDPEAWEALARPVGEFAARKQDVDGE